MPPCCLLRPSYMLVFPFTWFCLLPLPPPLVCNLQRQQVQDQEYSHPDNASLLRNCTTGTPVRVFRSRDKAKSNPVYVYDGLYKVVSHEKVPSQDGPMVSLGGADCLTESSPVLCKGMRDTALQILPHPLNIGHVDENGRAEGAACHSPCPRFCQLTLWRTHALACCFPIACTHARTHARTHERTHKRTHTRTHPCM
jgi:hypothetical protein